MRRSVAAAVTQFVLGGLAAVVLISAGTIYVVQRNATKEAVRNAREVAALSGRAVVEPMLADGMLTGDAAALARVDRVVRERVLSTRLVRVKIWSPEGRVVYSDEPRLIGQTFGLDAAEKGLLQSGKIEAGVSDLDHPENRFERSYGKLLEVYVPVHTTDGKPLLFESYLRFSSVAESSRRIWTSIAPVLVGGLLLLYLVQVPLAWSMARGLREGQEDRERLLRRAIDASDAERRRIARDLHDSVVQSLAGVSYSLAAAADRIGDADGADPDASKRELADALRQSAADTRRSMRDLRSLIVEIAPPNLHEEGLDSALGDLVAPLAASGVNTDVVVDEGAATSPETQTLLYRVAQEAVRNVVSHAEASRVTLTLARDNGHARLIVADDGRGFSPDRLEEQRRAGHVGLTLLTGLVADAGGRLVVDSAPGEGTRVEAEVPVE